MADKQPTQAAGGDGREGAPDGVNDAAGKTSARSASGGGNYVDPGRSKEGGEGGFMGHGGQSEIDYHGTGDTHDKGVGNDNAVTDDE